MRDLIEEAKAARLRAHAPIAEVPGKLELARPVT